MAIMTYIATTLPRSKQLQLKCFIGYYYYLNTHQKRCTELRYKLGRGYNIKYALKIRIRVRTTTNISDDVSTHIVFGVVQLNIIRVIHTIKSSKSICTMGGRMEDMRHRKRRT